MEQAWSLLLLTTLRHTYDILKKGSEDEGTSRDGFYLPLLDVSARSGTVRQSSIIYASGLQVILRGLVIWITSTSSAAQRVRVNLYGALLNYLRIGTEVKPHSMGKSGLSEEQRLNLEQIIWAELMPNEEERKQVH